MEWIAGSSPAMTSQRGLALRRGVGERVHDVGDDGIDELHVVALGHHPDHRLGARGRMTRRPVLPSRDLPLSIALRTAMLSKG